MAEITINYNKIQESVALIEKEINNLKELFEKQNNNFELLSDTKMWFGSSSNSCINKYNELKTKYEDIINGLNNYKQFLLKVAETYENFNSALAQQADNQ